MVHIDVGDQKFISLNSDGFAWNTFEKAGFSTGFSSLPTYVRFCDEIDFFRANALSEGAETSVSSSSSILPVTISLDCPKMLDKIQPPWYFSRSRRNGLVKYRLEGTRRRVFGELFGLLAGEASGVAGKDLLPFLHCLSACSAEKFSWSLLDIIWLATRTIDFPQSAGSPWNPSSIPCDFVIFVLLVDVFRFGLVSLPRMKNYKTLII